MPRLASILTGRDIPPAELGGMRLDGEVYRLADAWCPIDEPETPAHRVTALLGERSPRLIAELGTAAWIWGATPVLPGMIELCSELGARARLREGAGLRVREIVLDPGDRIPFPDGAVTSPIRTAVDLARFRDSLSDEEGVVILELARLGDFGLSECQELMNRRPNLPGKRRAAERLGSLLSRGGVALSPR